MMDRLTISDITVDTIIGLNPWEREIKQPLVIGLQLDIDARPAGRSDQVTDTVDYGVIARSVRALVGQSRFRLIESVAEHIAAEVLSNHPHVEAVTVMVTKPHAIPGAGVTLTIERSRKS